jgi:hypothetical protein
MQKKHHKKYRLSARKKILATGGIVTSLWLGSSTLTFAQTTVPTPTAIERPFIDDIAIQFGLKIDDIKEELRLGKTPKEALLQLGVSQDKIQKLFKKKSQQAVAIKKIDIPPELLQAEAVALGLTIDDLKQELKNGQQIPDIALAQGLSMDQYRKNVIDHLEILLRNGSMSEQAQVYYKGVIARIQQSIT